MSDEWKIRSYLLCCKQIKGHHTGETICLEYESVLDYYSIEGKVFKAVTDNGSNMVKAFNVTFEELNEIDDFQSEEEAIDDDDTLTDDLSQASQLIRYG